MATVRLRCNARGCTAERQAKPGVSLDQLRQGLVEVGWYVDETRDLDLCPVDAHEYVERVL